MRGRWGLQVGQALMQADPSGVHLGLATRQPSDEHLVAAAPHALKKSLEAKKAAGVELTDMERRALRKDWRIAKNERRKAKHAIKRAKQQESKATHHHVRSLRGVADTNVSSLFDILLLCMSAGVDLLPLMEIRSLFVE